MQNKLTWNQIKLKYPNEWIMLVDYEKKVDDINPRSGVVIVHSKERKDFYEQMKKTDIKAAAIRYTGPISNERLKLWNLRK